MYIILKSNIWYNLYPITSSCFTPQLQQTEDITGFRELVTLNSDLISDSGYHKPVATGVQLSS